MPDFGPIVDAWNQGARLPAIALLALLLTSLVKKWAPTFWAKVPDGAKRWIPMGLAMVEAFGEHVLTAGEGPVLVVALNGILAGLLAIGGHHFSNPLKHATAAPPEASSTPPKLTDDDPTPTYPPRAQFVVWRAGLLTALFAAVFLPLVLSACSSVKPAARSVVDASRILCELFFAERAGLSVEEAGKLYCATEKQLRPWIDQALAAQQAAGAAVASPPERPEE